MAVCLLHGRPRFSFDVIVTHGATVRRGFIMLGPLDCERYLPLNLWRILSNLGLLGACFSLLSGANLCTRWSDENVLDLLRLGASRHEGPPCGGGRGLTQKKQKRKKSILPSAVSLRLVCP